MKAYLVEAKQFTVSAYPEFSYYQFRKAHHFSVSHALDLPIIMKSYALLCGVRFLRTSSWISNSISVYVSVVFE